MQPLLSPYCSMSDETHKKLRLWICCGIATGCLTKLAELLHRLLLVRQCCSMPNTTTAGEAIHGHFAQQESGSPVLWAWHDRYKRAERHQLPQESVQHARPVVQRPRWWASCLCAHCWSTSPLLFQVYFFLTLIWGTCGCAPLAACLLLKHLPGCQQLGQLVVRLQHQSTCMLSCAPVSPCPELGASVCLTTCTMHGACELFPDLLQSHACCFMKEPSLHRSWARTPSLQTTSLGWQTSQVHALTKSADACSCCLLAASCSRMVMPALSSVHPV